MKKLLVFPFLVVAMIVGCTSQKTVTTAAATGTSQDTIRIANDEIEYEITIFDPGFNGWFNAHAKPRGYYSQQYLEARNRDWVIGWNMRASNPSRWGRLIEFPIDYSATTDYGYEVNYMLYYYLTYFQIVNNIQLGTLRPHP